VLAAARSKLAALPRDSRDALFLLGVIAWLIVPLIPHTPTWGLAFVLIAWRASIAWRGTALPKRWVLLAVLAVAAGLTYYNHKTLLGRDAGVSLVVVLLVLKTLEMKGRRDTFVVFFLGFFALLTNFFFSQSLATATLMLVAVLPW
jgi:protein-glutamine gamma-glutamyltransferase